MKPIKLTIIDEDSTITENLTSFFKDQQHIDLMLTASSLEIVMDSLNQNAEKPNIILLDIHLPNNQSIKIVPQIKLIAPNTNIIMHTHENHEEKLFSALASGASSYIRKGSHPQNVFECILTVHAGGSDMSQGLAKKVINYVQSNNKDQNPLSKRHMEIVQAIVDGLSYKMVGDRLGIAIDTVRTHIMQIYRSLNIHSKGELIKWALDKH